VRFVWDEAKNITNVSKHGISFEEASALFAREDQYVEIFDEAHSDEEDRFIAIGPVTRGVVLVVYVEQDHDTVRIISARWATTHETEMYRSYVKGRSL
jgi:uncharacterized DUF497 family protein